MKRFLALGATAALVALGVLGALPEPAGSTTAFPPGRPTRVLVLGDSVMKGAEASVVAALPGREVVFDSEVNRSTGAGADVVAQRGGDWDVAVVLLGHNDGGSPGAYQPAARRILDQLRGVPYVSWLTIHEVRPYYPDVNHFIAGLQGDYPNLHIGDWNAIANAHPEAVAGDGLHLNGTGAGLMAGLVTEQVEGGELQWNAALLRLIAAQATTTTSAPPTTTTTAPPTTTSTSTSTTTSTTEPTTTSRPSNEGCIQVLEDGKEVRCDAAPDEVDTDSMVPAGAIAGVAVVLVGAGAGIAGLRRRRRRRSDEADTAG